MGFHFALQANRERKTSILESFLKSQNKAETHGSDSATQMVLLNAVMSGKNSEKESRK
jgi:hypothetical protein